MLFRFAFTRLALVSLAAALLFAEPVRAERPDHDAVRRAVERHEILSLLAVLDIVRGKLPGEIAGVEIERKDDRWVYEFRVVDGQGRLFEVHVDARTGEIVQTKEK